MPRPSEILNPSPRVVPGNVTVHEPATAAPSGDWRNNNFDLVRLFATLQVAIVHAITHFQVPGSLAHVVDAGLRLFPGVPIFFVVSGFLISNSYEHSDSLRHYLRNRCLRIYPALWVCLVATVGALLLVGVDVIGVLPTRDWLVWWAAQLTLFQNYSPGFEWPPGVGTPNFSLWTIPVELEFYMLVPAIYVLFRLTQHRGNIPLLALCVASAALHLGFRYEDYRTSNHAEYRYLLNTVAPYLWMFLVGVLMQRNWGRLRPLLAGRAHWWLLGYLALCGVANRLGVDVGSNTITPLFFCPLAGLVVASATSAPGLADRILRRQDISYGTYLYHLLVINVMVSFGLVGSAWPAGGAIAIALLLATASWVLVEKPFLRRKRAV
jgi:peptidoglycan/LPS O-acetylase OafA/YrhL